MFFYFLFSDIRDENLFDEGSSILCILFCDLLLDFMDFIGFFFFERKFCYYFVKDILLIYIFNKCICIIFRNFEFYFFTVLIRYNIFFLMLVFDKFLDVFSF